jgi:hypothetical protein
MVAVKGAMMVQRKAGRRVPITLVVAVAMADSESKVRESPKADESPGRVMRESITAGMTVAWKAK